MTDLEMHYLLQCRALMVEKTGWGPSKHWKQPEFDKLSELIQNETGYELSSKELKLIFGRLHHYNLPDITTLNALAGFAGFENWTDFKQAHDIPKAKNQILQVHKHNLKKILITSAALLGLTILLGFIFLPGVTSRLTNTGGIIFKTRPLENGFPNKVSFLVDLKEIQSNKILIEQDRSPSKTISLEKGQKEATALYYFPGYYHASLLVDGDRSKEHDLFIRSDQWMATIDKEPIPTYFKSEELIRDKGMQLCDSDLKKLKRDSNTFYLSYHLVKPFAGLTMENFTLETSIKNILNQGSAACQTSKIMIIGTRGKFIIPFSLPECVSNLNLRLKEKNLVGNSHDLRVFGTDLKEWKNIRVDVRNRLVRIYMNGKLLKEEGYTEDAGELIGLRFSFLGAGSVKYVLLSNERGKKVYEDSFGPNVY